MSGVLKKSNNLLLQKEIIKEKQENTSKQVMEIYKTTLDLKREVDTMKKTQTEATHGTFSKIDHIIGHKTGLNR
jgi:hypothetical protein